MNATEALTAISDQLSEFDSFAEGFDHVFHGDYDEDADSFEGGEDFDPDTDCRFAQANTVGAFEALQELIDAAGFIIDGENDVRRGNIAGSYAFDIVRLANVLGRKLEPHPDYGDEQEGVVLGFEV